LDGRDIGRLLFKIIYSIDPSHIFILHPNFGLIEKGKRFVTGCFLDYKYLKGRTRFQRFSRDNGLSNLRSRGLIFDINTGLTESVFFGKDARFRSMVNHLLFYIPYDNINDDADIRKGSYEFTLKNFPFLDIAEGSQISIAA